MLAIELIGIVPADDKVLMSANRGLPVALDERSPAGLAYRSIAQRLQGEELPFPRLEEAPGFLARLARFARLRNS